jgi:hypothetical protein
MVRVITAVLTGPTGRLGRHRGGRPPGGRGLNAGILGGSATSAQGKDQSKHEQGGGVSARPLPMPINPALLKHAEQRRKSLENRVADQITRFAGSMLFVYLHIIWFASWIILGVEHYPYGLLTMIVSLEAIFLSTFVMISQNRADEKTPGPGGPPVADRPGGGAAERGAAGVVQPDPGAHQGDPRAGHRPVAHRPGRRLTGTQQTEGGSHA